jgi:hypothetical protein
MEKHTKKTYSHTKQLKVWENTKDLRRREIKIMRFSLEFDRFQSPSLFHAAVCGLWAGDRRTHTAGTHVVRYVSDLMADLP